MDKLTVKILELLERNGKLTADDIAVVLDTDVEVIQAKILELELNGIICGYQALINWDKTNDTDVSAVIELKVTPSRDSGYDAIAQKIYHFPAVEAMYLMSGRYDFLVILKKSNMRDISKFVHNLAVLPEVVSTSTHIVLERYKDHNTVLVVDQKDHRLVGLN